jgi:transcriptional regulator with XRE-family HTH domain
LPVDETSVFAGVGRAIFLLRELKGMSQVELARVSGIGRSQLAKYEKGRNLPRLESLGKLLVALSVSYQEFFHTVAMVDRRTSALGQDSKGEVSAAPRLTHCVDGVLSEAFENGLVLLYRIHRRIWERTESSPELQKLEDTKEA